MANQESPSAKDSHLVSLLGEQYDHLRDIAEETIRSLGEERAAHFTLLANDWMDVLSAISGAYSERGRLHSLVYFYLSGLFKEVSWFQLLFLAGNYPLLHRSLRFVWEMMFRAYYVDVYAQESQDDPEPPGPTLDEKVEWLAQHEREMFQWRRFIRPTLLRLLPQAEGTEIERYYKSLWDRLNEYVHPTKAFLDRMVIHDPASLVRDSFNAEWALETIGTATDVFDLVWLAVISRFPRCSSLIAQKGLHIVYPVITAALENA